MQVCWPVGLWILPASESRSGQADFVLIILVIMGVQESHSLDVANEGETIAWLLSWLCPCRCLQGLGMSVSEPQVMVVVVVTLRLCCSVILHLIGSLLLILNAYF